VVPQPEEEGEAVGTTGEEADGRWVEDSAGRSSLSWRGPSTGNKELDGFGYGAATRSLLKFDGGARRPIRYDRAVLSGLRNLAEAIYRFESPDGFSGPIISTLCCARKQVSAHVI
jgi:hypothetical protein